MHDRHSCSRKRLDANTSKYLRNKTIRYNSLLNYEELGYLLGLVNSNRFFGINYFNIFFKNYTETNNLEIEKAIIFLYIAKKNYQILTATSQDYMDNPNNFKLNYKEELENYKEIKQTTKISHQQKFLPNTYEYLKLVVIDILKTSANNLYKYFEFLPNSKKREAIEILKALIILKEDIINNNYNLEKLNSTKSITI